MGKVAAPENEDAGEISAKCWRQQPKRTEKARLFQLRMRALAHESHDRKARKNPGDGGQPEDQIEATDSPGALSDEADDRQRRQRTGDCTGCVSGLVEAERPSPRRNGNRIGQQRIMERRSKSPPRPAQRARRTMSRATTRTIHRALWSLPLGSSLPPPMACVAEHGRRAILRTVSRSSTARPRRPRSGRERCGGAPIAARNSGRIDVPAS